ncbi:Inactive purple acid phosphatase 29, partial [Globisporangium splendens]
MTRCSVLLGFTSALALLVSQQAPLAQNAAKPALVAKSSSDGASLSYKILQLADLHFTGDPTFPCLNAPTTLAPEDTPCSEALTTKFMNALLDAEMPDFVVFSGDNVQTLNVSNHQSAVDAFTQGVETRGIPYAVILGNHDDENGFPREEVMELVLQKNNSYAQRGPTTIDGVGNYLLTVEAPVNGAWGNAGAPVLQMYFLDSGGYPNATRYPNVTSKYDWIKDNQVEYYHNLSVAAQQNASRTSPDPAIMFFHIPLREYDYTAAEASTTNGEKNENVSSSDIESSLFSALVDRDEVKVTFAGHDHINEYCHKRQGIQLCYGGGTGFGLAYSAANFSRRARVIEWSLNAQNERTITSWKRLFTEMDEKYEKETLFTQVPGGAGSSEDTVTSQSGNSTSTTSGAPLSVKMDVAAVVLVLLSIAFGAASQLDERPDQVATTALLSYSAQVTDKDLPCTEALTTKFVNALLDLEKPDFVVSTGDNVQTFAAERQQNAIDAMTQCVQKSQQEALLSATILFQTSCDLGGGPFIILWNTTMQRLRRAVVQLALLSLLVLVAPVSSDDVLKPPLLARECVHENSGGVLETRQLVLSFKILQLADLHFTGNQSHPCRNPPTSLANAGLPCTEALTTKFVNALLDLEQPDFVVFSGDNVETFSSETHQAAIDAMTQGVQDRKIPFAAILGNHDDENGFPREKILEMVMEKCKSYTQRGPTTVDGVGNYQLNVRAPATGAWGQAGDSVLQMYFLDSGGYPNRSTYPNVSTLYDWIKPSQVAYYRELSLAAQKDSQEPLNPAIMFFHIPLQEYNYDASVDANLVNGEKNEGVSSSNIPSELFSALVERNEVKATFAGHDHVNDYCLRRKGIQLCYGGGGGLGQAYGFADFPRRARVIEWSVNYKNERTIKTWKRLFDNLDKRFVEQVLFTQNKSEMGAAELETKVALAERARSYDACMELLQYVRKEKLRVPRVVAKFGKLLVQNHSWRLGSDIWAIYEQVFVAALDLHDDELADEQRGEYAKAEEIYDEVLKGNPANALMSKRKIAILKAQKKTQDMIVALNDYLRNFQTDQAAWLELAETYLSIGAYRYGAFCYEELILLNPMDAIFHSRLADIYSTIGGLDNLRVARKHYSHSLEINKHKNVRGFIGLLACTKAIAAHRNYKPEADDAGLNERVQQFALDHLTQHYASNASSDIVDIGGFSHSIVFD